MTVRVKLTLLMGALVCANLAVWGARQFEAHLWLHDLFQGLNQF